MSPRVGLIVPSSNTVAEVDFHRRLPDTATLHTARIYLEQVTPEAETTMLDEHLPRAVADIGTTRPDVLVFACTSAGALRGNAAEEELTASISERTGVPTVIVDNHEIGAVAPERIIRFARASALSHRPLTCCSSHARTSAPSKRGREYRSCSAFRSSPATTRRSRRCSVAPPLPPDVV